MGKEYWVNIRLCIEAQNDEDVKKIVEMLDRLQCGEVTSVENRETGEYVYELQ